MVNLYDFVKLANSVEGFARGTYGVVLYCYNNENDDCDVQLVDEEKRTCYCVTCSRSNLLSVEKF